ncbi:hypothetical protein L1987_06845 [Smallanthus sonchifolius]|uniref:Uncharacterized protein n=1 Tax=Smallanthus sonchifolius TaxID=185202 RepID=A0ACB9JZF0_9ASTR|nr:hypothetical protein L1987_06845 [Smallanthus sonchifolius]
MFHVLYRMCLKENWYSFERRPGVKPHVGKAPTSLKYCKEKLFNVKAGVVPLEMYYYSTSEAIVDVPPKPSDYEKDPVFNQLVEHPAEVQNMSEEVLVGVGMSRIWERLDRIPILLLKGEGMLCEGFYDVLFPESGVQGSWIDKDSDSPDIPAKFEGNFLFPCFKKDV